MGDGVPVSWPAAADRGYLLVRTGLVDEPFGAAGRLWPCPGRL